MHLTSQCNKNSISHEFSTCYGCNLCDISTLNMIFSRTYYLELRRTKTVYYTSHFLRVVGLVVWT